MKLTRICAAASIIGHAGTPTSERFSFSAPLLVVTRLVDSHTVTAFVFVAHYENVSEAPILRGLINVIAFPV